MDFHVGYLTRSTILTTLQKQTIILKLYVMHRLELPPNLSTWSFHEIINYHQRSVCSTKGLHIIRIIGLGLLCARSYDWYRPTLFWNKLPLFWNKLPLNSLFIYLNINLNYFSWIQWRKRTRLFCLHVHCYFFLLRYLLIYCTDNPIMLMIYLVWT